MDIEVNPVTPTTLEPETSTPETIASNEAPTKIQEYKAKLDAVCKEYNLFLNSTLVCTDCGSTNIGTEVRIMEGGVIADPSQSEAPTEEATAPTEDLAVQPAGDGIATDA